MPDQSPGFDVDIRKPNRSSPGLILCSADASQGSLVESPETDDRVPGVHVPAGAEKDEGDKVTGSRLKWGESMCAVCRKFHGEFRRDAVIFPCWGWACRPCAVAWFAISDRCPGCGSRVRKDEVERNKKAELEEVDEGLDDRIRCAEHIHPMLLHLAVVLATSAFIVLIDAVIPWYQYLEAGRTIEATALMFTRVASELWIATTYGVSLLLYVLGFPDLISPMILLASWILWAFLNAAAIVLAYISNLYPFPLPIVLIGCLTYAPALFPVIYIRVRRLTNTHVHIRELLRCVPILAIPCIHYVACWAFVLGFELYPDAPRRLVLTIGFHLFNKVADILTYLTISYGCRHKPWIADIVRTSRYIWRAVVDLHSSLVVPLQSVDQFALCTGVEMIILIVLPLLEYYRPVASESGRWIFYHRLPTCELANTKPLCLRSISYATVRMDLFLDNMCKVVSALFSILMVVGWRYGLNRGGYEVSAMPYDRMWTVFLMLVVRFVLFGFSMVLFGKYLDGAYRSSLGWMQRCARQLAMLTMFIPFFPNTLIGYYSGIQEWAVRLRSI